MMNIDRHGRNLSRLSIVLQTKMPGPGSRFNPGSKDNGNSPDGQDGDGNGSRHEGFLNPRQYRQLLGILVTLVWTVVVIADVLMADFSASIAVHGIMGLIAGYFYSSSHGDGGGGGNPGAAIFQMLLGGKR